MVPIALAVISWLWLLRWHVSWHSGSLHEPSLLCLSAPLPGPQARFPLAVGLGLGGAPAWFVFPGLASVSNLGIVVPPLPTFPVEVSPPPDSSESARVP